MRYHNIVSGTFLERPNRFIARVEIQGREETVHVKNTGRCRELLIPGAQVYLERSDNTARATAYDLVAVKKGKQLINMDSQAPNRAAHSWLLAKKLFPDAVLVQPEKKYGSSRFDFYIEAGEKRIFMEVKGVTLEEDGVARFPDAPSERAVKHVEELIVAVEEGYEAYLLFVIQMKGIKSFEPNRDTQPAFAEALVRAAAAGVKILAYDCLVTPWEMQLDAPVEVHLNKTLRVGDIKEIPNPLLAWYDRERRILPWREEPTPYHVWVSEIMLQQTRVEAVKPYYHRFMKVLPDVEALANAEEELLLKLWEGLGYYSRVRNLKKAAVQIMEEHGGVIPDTCEELLKLQGIGSYTAGAIASIACHRAVPAVDGNVLRVLSRLRADERLISDARVRKQVEQELLAVIPGERPGDFNQAMMELGACVCIPNGAPACHRCPLQEICQAHSEGRELEFPRKEARKARRIEEKTVLIVRDENRVALRKRPPKGLLAGMYEFPSMDGFKTADQVVEYLAERGIKSLRILPLAPAKHIFTHREWHMTGYVIRVDELAGEKDDRSDWLYLEPWETQERYPIPSAFAAYTEYLNIKLGVEK